MSFENVIFRDRYWEKWFFGIRIINFETRWPRGWEKKIFLEEETIPILDSTFMRQEILSPLKIEARACRKRVRMSPKKLLENTSFQEKKKEGNGNGFSTSRIFFLLFFKTFWP